jgi:purine catabolism regulator
MFSPVPTLHDLIRVALGGRAAWLSGFARGRLLIEWVSTSPGDCRPGDLLLLSAERSGASPAALAQEKGAVALLLLGPSQVEVNPDPDGFPILSLPDEEDPRPIQRALLTQLINHRSAMMERGVRIHAQLSQLAAGGEGMPGLVQAMTGISGRGVVVQDKRLQVLASYPNSELSGIWPEVLEQIVVSENLQEPLRDRKRAGRDPMIFTQPIPGGLERLVTPIAVGGVARGYLSLVGIAGGMDSLDHLVAEQGALVCAVEMARTKAVREAEKRLKGDLLTALLEDELSPRDARLWAQNMELDLDKAHAALRFAWARPGVFSRRRLETVVNGEVQSQGIRAIVSPMGEEMVCFCELPSPAGRPEAALTLAAAVLAQARKEYPDSPARCGVGGPASDLSEWRNSFRQAGQALEMARRLIENKPLYFLDLSIYRLLFQIEHNPELASFQEETLGPLLATDGGKELLRTLEAYFEHHGNLSQTAEALYIHRNTLSYRLERIAEITGLDLDKPETRLSVQLALHIHRMRGND